jgi:hypothetical protein
MESLSVIYSLLPTIINSLFADKSEQGLPYDLLTKKIIILCQKINGNSAPMSHTQLKNITSTHFNITLEALIISAFCHYQGRMKAQYSDDEKLAYELLGAAMTMLHINEVKPAVLLKVARAHALKVLFNINLNHYKVAA